MSGKVKALVLEIIKNSKERLSCEDILNLIKREPEYQRTSKDALLPVVKQTIQDYNKATKSQHEVKKLLGVKRKAALSKEENESSSLNIDKFLYKPNINLSSLGGMTEIVTQMREIISFPLYHYEGYQKLKTEYTKGILLCGPPGCGKTTLAYAIGGEFQIPFYKITGPDIISSLSGESEQIIRKLFKTVIENAPSILFIDEIETILGKRETAGKEMERRIVAQIMSCIDEINYLELSQMNAPVFIIGATSKPEFIDNSMRRSGRFDKEIHIGFPTLQMRKEMLMSITKEKIVDDKVDYDLLAKMTPGYLAADVQSLVRTAGHSAINRYIQNKIPLDSLKIEQCDFEYGISVIQPTSKREGFTTIPNVTWNDVGGLSELRSELYYSIVMQITDPTPFAVVGITRACGVLLYGPPGCGKTLLAKAVANEAKANFISIKGPELLNKYVGESEKAIRSLFIRARNSSPCIIFFDELDALVPKRSNENNNASERVVNQLLTEMDGLEDRKQIFIIAATNRPDIIDPAMLRPGRLDKLLYVPLPNLEDRRSILETITKKLPIDRTKVNITAISKDKRIEDFSGADLASLVREAQLHSLKRLKSMKEKIDMKEFKIDETDFEYALKTILPSVSKTDKLRYEHLKNKIGESRSHINE